jgi:enoyl-CoA hydratase/carnithine racemase
VAGVTVDEQAVIGAKLANKIVVQPDQLDEEVKAIIIKRADVKTMVEKITIQEVLSAGTRTIPTVADAIAELPVMVWPV